MTGAAYDPFEPGPFTTNTRTFEVLDDQREQVFPVDIWYPTAPGPLPLIVYSHSSGGNRRSASFLCSHLASHGYAVAAMDHSELVAETLARRDGETADERSARIDALIASRVPDIRFLLDELLREAGPGIELDSDQIGLMGHSFGGWTVLATLEVDARVASVVAMAPGGSANQLPGILPVRLTFAWTRDVPVLYLAAEQDVPIPLPNVVELFERSPSHARMFILRRADHQHFVDDVEGEHEAIRSMTLPGDSAWIPAAMRPMEELSSGAQAHLFVRGLTLAHFDATLRMLDAAAQFLTGDVVSALAARGVEAIAYQS